jgi:hypothetical protein
VKNETGSEPPQPQQEEPEPIPYILPGSDTPPEPQEGEAGYSPYGITGGDIGDAAVNLRDRIAASGEQTALPSHPPVWDKADEMALSYLLRIEERLPSPSFERELGEPIETHFPDLARFHAALPFTDAEREWLVAKSRALWQFEPKDMQAIHDRTLSIEQKITELGAQQGVAGADMVRRWAAWRRNADEFKENSTREDAAYALDKLVGVLYPYGPYPYDDD